MSWEFLSPKNFPVLWPRPFRLAKNSHPPKTKSPFSTARQLPWRSASKRLSAARAVLDSASLVDCQKLAEKVRPNTGVFFAVETLEFLHRGGRIGGAQWLLGSAMNMKPILTINEGIVDSADRARTLSKAHERVI